MSDNSFPFLDSISYFHWEYHGAAVCLAAGQIMIARITVQSFLSQTTKLLQHCDWEKYLQTLENQKSDSVYKTFPRKNISTSTVTVNGEVKVFPRERLKLTEHAVPTIFPNTPKYLSTAIPTVKRLSDVEEESTPSNQW